MNESLGDLDALASLLNQDSQPIFLLGAGASAKSGIPLSGELVDRIGKWGYCRQKNRSFDDPSLMRTDWWPWVKQQSWFRADLSMAENYSKAVDAVLRPQSNRKAFFHRILRPHVPISAGYGALARMLARKVVRTVLTTNFDQLLATAARSLPEVHAVEEIKTPDDFKILSSAPEFPQVIYLHGSVDHYTDQNIEEETKQLHPRLIDLLTPLLRDHPLVVVGYRGAEPSVMRTLLTARRDACMGYRHGIYWCHRIGRVLSSEGSLVNELAECISPNLQFVPIAGFDELMEHLEKSSRKIHRSTFSGGASSDRVRDIHDLRPSKASLGDLNDSLLRPKLLAYAAAVDIPGFDPSNPGTLRGALVDRNLAINKSGTPIPTNGGLLLFGKDVHAFLPHAHIAVSIKGPGSWIDSALGKPEPSRGMDEFEEEVRFSGDLWTQLQQASDLLARINAPFRLKGATSQVVYPYPPLALRELLTNLLAHRDYSVGRPSELLIDNRQITFRNDGGLVEHVQDQLDERSIQEVVGAEGRGIKGYRNPVIADFFFSAGAMDKEGSGLPDVVAEAQTNSNDVTFGPEENNTVFIATIRCRPEALEIDRPTRTARSKLGEQRYLPNLLSIVRWPEKMWKVATIASPKEFGQIPNVPFCVFRDWIWTFTDPKSEPAKPLLDLAVTEEIYNIEVAAFLDPMGPAPAIPRLLNSALTNHLTKLGLRIRHEQSRLRAYFPAQEGAARSITYRGLFKQATRTVAKPIQSMTTQLVRYWEHKAATFRFEPFGAQWALSIVPGYVFTEDGDQTSILPERIGPLSTRRASRDYNPTVLHDLVFWSRIISGGAESTFRMALTPTEGSTDFIELAAVIPTHIFREQVDADDTQEVTEIPDDEQGELDEAIVEAIEDAIDAETIKKNEATDL